MVSADGLIQALHRRLRIVAPHLRRRPGEFPPGWQAWLESLSRHPGRITGVPAESIVAVLAQRPLAAAPRRLQGLTRWQAFSTLWRQQWQPAAREDLAWRWFAAALSVLAHLIFAVVLFWLTYLQFTAAPPRKGEDIVQVELIGRGTPQETGGGAPAEPVDPADPTHSPEMAEPAETAPIAKAAEPVQPEPATEAVAEPTDTPPAPVAVDAPTDPAETVVPPAEAAPPPVVKPTPVEPEPAPVEQAVDVSEPVPNGSDEFVLTAPIPRVSAPDLPSPELRAPASTVQVIDIPAPLVPASPVLPEQAITAPALSQRVPGVAPREIPAPLRAPVVTAVEPAISAPQLQARVPQVRTVTIPTPRRTAAAEQNPSDVETSRQSAETAVATTATAVEAATAAADPPSSRDGTEPPGGRSPETATPGTGPQPAAAPGGWATPARDDDWGDAARNRPGAERGDDGLYNSDGSLRLAETPGSASPGAPPGAVTDEIINLDRAGTWLKRPPIDYEPTAFDRYWRPNETLLEEWVRKSIRTVRIPIPGTNKHIVCQTVLLALGGGCGISDPNLNEQAATARPPPDIPFKPELQEDNGSIRPGTQIAPAPPLRGSGDPSPNPL